MLIFRYLKFLKRTKSGKNSSPSVSLNAMRFLSNDKIAIDMSYDEYKQPIRESNFKPPLIIMHGLFGSKHNWRSICVPFLKNFQKRDIILVDARNHGDSPHTREHRYEDMAEDVAEFLNKRNLDQVAVLGHSMGGRCMMYFALKYPHFVEKAVIVDISPLTQSESLSHMETILEILEQVHVARNLDLPDALMQVNEQLKQLNITNSFFRNFLLTNWVRNTDGNYRWQFNLEALRNNFSSHTLLFPSDAVKMKYDGPLLFIGGANSDAISEDELPMIQKMYFPNSQIIMVQNCGHLVHVDQPKQLITLVSEFLDKI